MNRPVRCSKTSPEIPRLTTWANTCRPPAVDSGFTGIPTEGVNKGRVADDPLQLTLHLLFASQDLKSVRKPR